MLIPGQPHFASDSDSLQTDVMRFMAIIAFCLIAILALVRNTEPTAAHTDPKQHPEASAKQITAQTEAPIALAESSTPPVSLPATEPPRPVEPSPEPKPVAPAAPIESVPVIPPDPPTRIARAVATTPPTVTEAPDVTVQAPQEPLLDQEPPLEKEQTPDQGLTLRFASDSDFLRLIARGDISVYAFDGPDVLKLDGQYRFLDASSPGQVYELLPASIPSLLVDALKQERLDVSDYHWGIALPSRIRTRIERYLNNLTNGQLVIDRYGDVHHVAAS